MGWAGLCWSCAVPLAFQSVWAEASDRKQKLGTGYNERPGGPRIFAHQNRAGVIVE